eukprot:COSAG06_NODE_36013_length_452_cov_22.968839_1_plen_47_part_01
MMIAENPFNRRMAPTGPQLHDEPDYVERFFAEAPYRAKVTHHSSSSS